MVASEISVFFVRLELTFDLFCLNCPPQHIYKKKKNCPPQRPNKMYIRYETSAHLWLVLEYCVGGDLMALLRQVMHFYDKHIWFCC